MRVSNFTAGLLLTTALISVGLMAFTTSASAHPRKTDCACECPPARPHHAAVRTPHMIRKVVRVIEDSSSDYSYNYSANSTVASPAPSEWHGDWHVAPSDVAGPCCVAATAYPAPQVYYAPAPAPLYYVPAAAYGYVAGGETFTGGVGYGYAAGGYAGGGGGYGGGYGGAYFGGGVQNGPTYNSYGQSFQANGAVAGPFQARVMGGFATH